MKILLLAFYIWLIDNNIDFIYQPKCLWYLSDDGKKHRYLPDFLINNEYIEIKGNHLIDNNNNLINPRTQKILIEKTKCLKDNNVKIINENDIKKYLEYINDHYGIKYLDSFKVKKNVKNKIN